MCTKKFKIITSNKEVCIRAQTSNKTFFVISNTEEQINAQALLYVTFLKMVSRWERSLPFRVCCYSSSF